MWIKHTSATWCAAALLAISLVACAPRPDRDRGGASAILEAQASQPARPLHIALGAEPNVLGGKFGGGNSGSSDYSFLFGAKLAHYDETGTPVPVLIEELPSLERGTWRLFPDGTMETTYRLRANQTWHDGAPFTAEDVRFTWASIMDPMLPANDREPEKFIASVDVVDARTLNVRWNETYIFANAWDLEPIPRHLLEPLAVRDPQSFANAGTWGRDWVGLGPYQLVEWVQGSYLRGRAFGTYPLGAPRIPEVFVHFILDSNQVVAQMLAGTIDVTLGNALRVEEGILIKEQLEARGEATVMTIPTKHRYGEFQYRPPQPPPSRDPRVRAALVHASDRQLLVDTLLRGLTTPADMYLTPNDAAFPAADRAIRKYPFEVSRAQALLQDAGWARGADGILRSSGGEQLDLEVRTTDGTQNLKEAQVLGDFWKQLGVNTAIDVIPLAKQNDQEYRAKFPGISLSATSVAPDWMDKWQTDRIASEANRWRGANRGGYSRLELDQLYKRYVTTVDPLQRQDALVQLIKFASEDVTYVPLYYQVDVHAIRSGLKGLTARWPGQSGMAFNAYLWYWETT